MGSIHASVWDLADKQNLPEGVEPGSIDIIVMIFVLSALHPNEWRQAVSNVYRVSALATFLDITHQSSQMLRPGGMVLMRDYGRHDLTQLRFKEDRLLDDNLYVRGDGTRVYFFTLGGPTVTYTFLSRSLLMQPQTKYQPCSLDAHTPVTIGQQLTGLFRKAMARYRCCRLLDQLKL